MKIETLHDVLEWTQQSHKQLGDCLHRSADEHQQERARMLLEYLSDHEQRLAKLVEEFDSGANSNALNTFCNELFQKKSLSTELICDKPYGQMDTDEILAEVSAVHEQVIDVYRQLADQFEPPHARELIEQLLDLEQHEAMRIVQGSNRLSDI